MIKKRREHIEQFFFKQFYKNIHEKREKRN